MADGGGAAGSPAPALSEADALRAQVARVTDELNATKTALREANARVEQVEADAADARKKEAVAKSQINRAMTLAEKAEGDFKRQKELLQAAIARQSGYQRETKALQDEIDGYKHKHEVAERELQVARAECERLGMRLVETQKVIAQRESEAASATATLKHQVATLLYEVENERTQRKAHEERLPLLQKQLAEVKQRLTDRDRAATEAIAAKDAELEKLEERLRETREVRALFTVAGERVAAASGGGGERWG
jgi:chromosome segregation ATPase